MPQDRPRIRVRELSTGDLAIWHHDDEQMVVVPASHASHIQGARDDAHAWQVGQGLVQQGVARRYSKDELGAISSELEAMSLLFGPVWP